MAEATEGVVERTKNKRERKILSVLLFSAWIGFMALAGFFIPSFLSNLPLFQVREVIVEGNRTVDLSTVMHALYSQQGSIMKLDENSILRILNERTGGRVKGVFLSRKITLKGVSVRIRIEERVPVAKVRVGKRYMLIDREGKTFPPYKGHPKGLVEVRTYDLKTLQLHFPRLYSMIERSRLEVSRIEIMRDKTILVSGRRVFILPPADLLPENLVDRLRMIYNFQGGEIDLRFDRFILVRN